MKTRTRHWYIRRLALHWRTHNDNCQECQCALERQLLEIIHHLADDSADHRTAAWNAARLLGDTRL